MDLFKFSGNSVWLSLKVALKASYTPAADDILKYVFIIIIQRKCGMIFHVYRLLDSHEISSFVFSLETENVVCNNFECLFNTSAY